MTLNPRFFSFRNAALGLLTCAILAVAAMPAQATLMVMPIWVIFKDRDRTANVTVINTSSEESVFRIGWRYQRQVESGSYAVEETAIDPNYDVAKMVLYSPRQVVLPPNGKQRVRLSLRRPADLPDGEYRAHLLLTRLGTEASAEAQGQKIPEGKMALALNMNVGYSLPVIIRQGAHDSTAKISEPQFLPAADEKNPARLQIRITRSGKFSTMGKVVVYWTPPGQPEQIAGVLNNVNIFPELETRVVPVPLKVQSIPNGTVRIVYEGDGPDKGKVFDEQTVPIGG